MEEITEQEAKKMIEQGKEEMKKILENDGRIIDTTIREKDKVTTIRKIELADGKSTSSKIVTRKDEITIDFL